MATRGERIFAWVGVVVAVLSAVALTGAVIIQQIIDNRNAQVNQDLSTALQQQQQKQQQQCAANGTEATLPAPAVFKPQGAVTHLQATDLAAGSGAAIKAGDCVVAKYYGTLASNGTLFDENFTKPTAFAFIVGQGQVIKGWDEGLIGMKVGATRRLVIPSDMGYGSQGSGSIPPNAALVFVVKALRIQ